MRNWKSGRICNYLMKGLLLCALVVGGWFTAGIGAKAESLTHSVEFKSEESQIVQFERADGLEQHIEVTNNTQRPMKVTFSHNVPIRNYHTELRIGGHEVASRMATAVKDANVLYLYPCQWVEKACEVKFTTSAPAYTDITISAEYIDQKIGFKEDEIGLTKDTAYEIPLSGHPYSLYEGLTGTGTGTDERWYKFNVADKAVIDPSFHLVNTERATYFGQNRTFIRVYDSNNNQIYSEGSSQYNGKAKWNVDIVLSHTVPIEAEPVWAFIPGLDQSAVDKTTEKWLQKIYDRLDFTEWYAGHYHVESEECGIRIMYEDYDEICAEG